MGPAIVQSLPEEPGVPVSLMKHAPVSPINPYPMSNILRGQGMLERAKFNFIDGQRQN